MNKEEFIIKYINKEFKNEMVLNDYITSKKFSRKDLIDIAHELKKRLGKFPGCANKKKEDIKMILRQQYFKGVEIIEEIIEEEVIDPPSKFVLNKKGHEIVVVTTESDAKQLQNKLDEEETFENRLTKLEMERNDLIDTIDNLTKENIKLKDQINCSKNYVCSDDEKCNINTNICIPDEKDNDDDDLEEFTTEEGHKYIGNRNQIEKLKKRLANQNQLVKVSRVISEPNMFNINDETSMISKKFTDIEIQEQKNITNRINSILSIN